MWFRSRGRAVVLIMLLYVSGAGLAAAAQEDPVIASQSAGAADDVVVQQDVPYGPLAAETLDLCLPRNNVSPRPGVLLIHGGGWHSGRKGFVLCREFALHGMIGAAIDYRLVRAKDPSTYWPAQLVDAQLAVRWLRAHADQINLDKTRLCAQGDSAGAHLAVFLGVDDQRRDGDQAHLYANEAVKVSCVIDNFGPVDLTDAGRLAKSASVLLGGANLETNRQAFVEASPLFLVSSSSAPMLVEQGDADVLVQPSQSTKLVAALQKASVPVKYVTYSGGHEWYGMPRAQFNHYKDEEMQYLENILHP